MKDMMNLAELIDSPADALVLLSTTVGIVGLLLFPFFKQARSTAIKIFAGILVTGIGFAANNAFVYALTLFVVATLVTELEFLEKLAALAWGRKEYWKYLLNKAPPEVMEQKAREEALELEEEARPLEIRRSFMDDALVFERSVFNALHKHKLFPHQKVKTELSLSGKGTRYLIDAIVEGPKGVYVIEVKASDSRRVLQRGMIQLRSYASMFKNYLNERGKKLPVTPLLVVPSSSTAPDIIEGIGIVKFERQKEDFINLDEVLSKLHDHESSEE